MHQSSFSIIICRFPGSLDAGRWGVWYGSKAAVLHHPNPSHAE
jgi:hypothetical protein